MLTDAACRAMAQAAIGVKENAYAPYSGFPIGAVLLAASGEHYLGVNVENAAFSAGCCAERAALYAALAAGERDFVALAVAGGGEEADYCVPCGVCRQVLAEFCDPGFVIVAVNGQNRYRRYTLGELMPEVFDADRLYRGRSE